MLLRSRAAPGAWLIVTCGAVVIIGAILAGGLVVCVRSRKLLAPAKDQFPLTNRTSANANTVAFLCPGCGKTLRANGKLAGQKGKCPQCGCESIAPQLASASDKQARRRRPLTRRMKQVLGLSLILVLAPACWFPLGEIGSDPAEMKARFHQDLRRVDLAGPHLMPVNKEVESGPGGVRVLIAAGREKAPPAGLALSTTIRGDFEITTQFEILKADVPATGFGVGVSLYAQAASDAKNAVSLARRVLPGGQTVFVTERATGGFDGNEQHRLNNFPTSAMAGKLRLKRTGPIVRYQVAENDSNDFVELDQVDMGTDDIQFVQIGGHTGDSNAGLDLRLLDFIALARELPGLRGTTQRPSAREASLVISVLTGFALLFAVGWRVRPTFSSPYRDPELAEAYLVDDRIASGDALVSHVPGLSQSSSRWRQVGMALATGIPLALSVGMALLARSPEATTGPLPTAARQLPQNEKRWSLRGIPEDRQLFAMNGPDANQCVKFEPTGLRISLPTGYPGSRPSTGLGINQRARGDFDIIVGFELLREPAPADSKGDQTRITLEAILDTPHWDMATVSRRVTSKEGKRWTSWLSLWDVAAAKSKYREESFSTTAMKGRLRLVRTGPLITYYASEGRDHEWIRLCQYPFGLEDLRAIGLVASTGEPGVSFDVRLTDLSIKAGSLLNGASIPSTGTEDEGGWLGAGIAMAGAAALMVLSLWFAAQAGWFSAGPDTRHSTGAASSMIAFPCPGCGKNLHVKAGWVGRKGRCLQCGTEAFVPSPGGLP